MRATVIILINTTSSRLAKVMMKVGSTISLHTPVEAVRRLVGPLQSFDTSAICVVLALMPVTSRPCWMCYVMYEYLTGSSPPPNMYSTDSETLAPDSRPHLHA
jgi:hypothetical protein